MGWPEAFAIVGVAWAVALWGTAIIFFLVWKDD